jgi:hypothetical protein
VAADSAALAAADCMARGTCTSVSAGTTTAQAYVTTNTIQNSSVTISTTADNVTVTAATSTPATFGGVIGLAPKESAVAVASWVAGSAPYSFFAGNTSCGSGTGIWFGSNGGGTTYVPGVHSNGLLVDNGNTGSGEVTGSVTYNSSGSPACSGTTPDNSKNLAYVSSGTSPLPWPKVYYQPTTTAPSTCTYTVCPTCAHTGAYFTTDPTAPSANQLVSGGGVYCVTSAFTGTCTAPSGSTNPVNMVSGAIYLNAKVTGVELVAPCVVVTSNANGSSAIAGAGSFDYPLVFGTGTLNPTLGANFSKSSANPTVFLGDANNGGGLVLNGAVYAPGACSTSTSWDPNQTCSGTVNGGTVEFSGNNQLTGFIEAENIWVDKNNFGTIAGNGPTNPYGGTALTQ